MSITSESNKYALRSLFTPENIIQGTGLFYMNFLSVFEGIASELG